MMDGMQAWGVVFWFGVGFFALNYVRLWKTSGI